ncbi:MAG: carboxypeptidase-like regulatory domain-containing protein [Candidatus Binatia bacterium]
MKPGVWVRPIPGMPGHYRRVNPWTDFWRALLMEGRRQVLTVILGTIFLLGLLACIVVCTAEGAEIHAPGTTHICNVSWADTDGNWYTTQGVIDSVAIWIYAPPGSLWQHGAMTEVRPGEWIFSTDADSAEVQGDYWATMIAYSIGTASPPAKERWQVSDHFASFGGRTITVACVDTSATPDAAVPAANVTVRGLTTTTVVASGASNASGAFVFTYPAGIDTLRIQAEKLGQVIFETDTLALATGSASVTDSLLGYAFDPGAPADPTRCIVYGYLLEDNVAVEDVLVTRQIVLPSSAYSYVVVTATGTIIPWGEVDTTTDSSGYFQFELNRNSNLTPANTTYIITIHWRDHAGKLRKIPIGFTIAAGTSCPVDLGEINL